LLDRGRFAVNADVVEQVAEEQVLGEPFVARD
jgi:hypothetical protein